MKLFFTLVLISATTSFAGTLTTDNAYDNADIMWHVTHKPNAATQATISKAAVAGRRHVVTCVEATIATDSTAQTPIYVDLKDGSTVVKSWAVSAPANGQGGIALCGLKVIGTTNTAMTLEFSGAGVAANRQAVNMSGYDVY